ncbi:MAG: hypothetical protein DI629_21320 [Mesorhizobium amorphae]|nr:MAG: hypothetical protein DI629_21320 [Mesorhizobium amorphae]
MRAIVHPAITRSLRVPESLTLPDRPTAAAAGALPDRRVPVFATLPWAAMIVRHGQPGVRAGLVFRPETARRSVWSEMIRDRDALLWKDSVMLTWGAIARDPDLAIRLGGGSVFVRPDSGLKPFTGFVAASADELRLEIASRPHVDAAEICHAAPVRVPEGPELRVWVSAGTAVSSASYGWSADDEDASPRWAADGVRLAETAARDLETVDEAFVLDLCLYRGDPRIVELNAYATSGWYRGADPDAIIEGGRAAIG